MLTFSCHRRTPCATARLARGLAAAVAVLTLVAAGELRAARYQVDEPQLTPAQARTVRVEVGKILRNSTSVGDHEKRYLSGYFDRYFFPSMTLSDAESLGELAKRRKELFQQYINFAKSQEVRDYLIQVSITKSAEIAMGNYHPAVRYNAVLIIGGLDEKSERNQPPVVSPAATKALLYLVKNDEYQGTPIPSSAKVAALIGLQRHARFGVQDEYNAQIVEAALSVIDRKEIPEDANRSVHNWMRVQAAEVLAYQGANGATGEMTAALAKLMSDSSIKLPERCRVAEMLPRMKLAASDAETLGPALKKLADAVLKAERKTAEDYRDELLEESGFTTDAGFGGGGAYGGGGGYGRPGGGYGRPGGGEMSGGYGRPGGGPGGGMGPTELKGPQYPRRRMLHRMVALGQGIKAAENVAEGEAKQNLSDMLGTLQSLAKFASDKSSIDLDVAGEVITAAQTVERQAADWSAAAVPPAASADELGDAAAEDEGPAAAPADETPPAEQPADVAALEEEAAVTQ